MIQRALDSLRRRVYLMLARGVVRAVQDDGGLQALQLALLPRELLDQLERFQEYGFTSAPHAGAEAVVAFLGGNRSHGVVLAVEDRRYRLRGLEAGEVALYTDEGDQVLLRRGRVVHVVAGAGVELETPTTTLSGDLLVKGNAHVEGNHLVDGDQDVEGSISAGGNVETQADVKAAGQVEDALGNLLEIRTVFNSHTHAGGTVPPPDQQMT